MPLGPFFNGNGAVPEALPMDPNYPTAPDNLHKGDQVRGTGFLHDGSTDTLFRFLQATVFNDSGMGPGASGFDGPHNGNSNRRSVELFLLAFDNDIAPIVGQQITLTSSNDTVVSDRIDLLIQRAGTAWAYKNYPQANECDLVVKGTIDGQARSYYYDADSTAFVSDRSSEAPLSDSALRALVDTASEALTYTCYPPGSLLRGVDRDSDGALDGDEIDGGCDPDNASSTCLCAEVPRTGCVSISSGKSTLYLKNDGNPVARQMKWTWKPDETPVSADFGDPLTTNGYALCVYSGGELISHSDAPAGGTCGTRPCWSSRNGIYRYRDLDRTPNGTATAQLKSRDGFISGMSFKAKGSNLDIDALTGVTVPMVVQLQRGGSSPAQCWEANYTQFRRQDPLKVTLKLP
jgi:hypothetical protein